MAADCTPGDRREALEQRSKEICAARGIRVTRLRQRDLGCEHALGIETGVDGGESHQAAHRESGADGQQQSQCHFRHHQASAETAAARAFPGPPPAFLEVFDQPRAPGDDRRGRAEQEDRCKRGGQRKSQHGPVYRRLAQHRKGQVGRGHRVDTDPGQSEADRRREQRHHAALDQHQPGDGAPAPLPAPCGWPSPFAALLP